MSFIYFIFFIFLLLYSFYILKKNKNDYLIIGSIFGLIYFNIIPFGIFLIQNGTIGIDIQSTARWAVVRDASLYFDDIMEYFLGLFLMLTSIFIFTKIKIKKYSESNFIQNLKALPSNKSLIIMLFIFLSGLLIIDNMYGNQNKEIDLLLNIDGDVNNRYFENGSIKCSNPYTDIYVNSTISCEVFPESKIEYAKVILISTIGDKEVKDIGNMSFVLPYEISRIMFELNLTRNNTTYHVTTANNYKNIFTSYQDSLKRDSSFMAYLIALFGLVFISVPPMVEKFKKMTKG